MLPHNLRAVPVTDNSRLVGIVTIGDMHARCRSTGAQSHRSRQIMGGRDGLQTVNADTPAIDAVELLAEHDLEQMPVLDNGELVGDAHPRRRHAPAPAARGARRPSSAARRAPGSIWVARDLVLALLRGLRVLLARAGFPRRACAASSASTNDSLDPRHDVVEVVGDAEQLEIRRRDHAVLEHRAWTASRPAAASRPARTGSPGSGRSCRSGRGRATRTARRTCRSHRGRSRSACAYLTNIVLRAKK